MVVINTNAGNEKVPAWSLNLKANPEAEVEIGREKRAVVARVAEGEERADLWRRHNEQFEGFDEYERKLLSRRRKLGVARLISDEPARSDLGLGARARKDR